MTDLKLTDQEREFLLEVLRAKERNLCTETRRTESFHLHQELREEQRVVDRLLERLATAEKSTPLT
jgi:hypothetical protein